MFARYFGAALLGVFLVCGLVSPGPARAAPYAAMVMDARNGEVLHARNADTRLHPASLTKMMTLYIAFEALRLGEITLDTEVTVSANAAAEPPSRLGLRAGSTIRFRYLVRAAAIRSANDAATAIGEALEGSEAAFARRMNRTAIALGMTRTTFRNAHGLTEEGHLSTARDMTMLGRRLVYDYPQYYNIFSRITADAGIAEIRNTNHVVLNTYRGADGIKTGYTRAAGFNLVASAQRGEERIIATVFGGQSSAWRNQRVMELLDMGFERAPSNVALRIPPLPTYTEDPGELPATDYGVSGALAVSRSIRPVMRPGAAPDPELVAAISAAVGEALTNIDAPDPEVATAVEAAAGAVAGALPATAMPAMSPVQRPDPEGAIALDTAAPLAAPVATTAGAGPEGATAPAEDPALEGVLAEGDGPVADPVADPVAGPDSGTAPGIELAALDAGQAVSEPDAAAAIPEEAQLAAAPLPIPPLPAPEPEVVTRASSSGTRLFGVSLGPQSSHYEAERLLLRTALAEIGTFDTALRRVVSTGRGFDARFAGMTEEQAALACARLSARSVTCEVFGP